MEKIMLEFSEIYMRQTELRKEMDKIIDCSMLTGTDCYCDPETQKELMDRIPDCASGKIHLMDSGNYHYMSRLFLEACKKNVSLVMLDNHTDMQPAALLPVLSCGSWLMDTLREVPEVREVFLIGPPEEALHRIPEEMRKSISIISREQMETGEWKKKLNTFIPEYPVYFSVDKDVLSPEVCRTNWDQGIMTLAQLKEILEHFLEKYPVAGADICGEPQVQNGKEREFAQSMRINREIIGLFADRYSDSLDKYQEER